MYPTFVELCGLSNPDQTLEGESIATTLANPGSAEDRTVYLPYLTPGEYALMNSDWRYIHWQDGDELYNERTDPNEWQNLASNPEYDAVKARLQKSAPRTFAKPAAKLNARKHLLFEGETFRWEVNKAK